MSDKPQLSVRDELRDSWRIFKIISEFVDGFETMLDIGPSVSIFGSARYSGDTPYHKMARDVGAGLAKKGFATITGGGAGLMIEANRGAKENGGISCGLTIRLPFEEEPNTFIDPNYTLNFRYFFVRKVMFTKYAQSYVVLPGGLGTLDELMEALTLIQTKKIKPFPIYLMGTDYWSGLLTWLKDTVLSHGMMSESDLDLFRLTDDPQEVIDGIEAHFRAAPSVENY